MKVRWGVDALVVTRLAVLVLAVASAFAAATAGVAGASGGTAGRSHDSSQPSQRTFSPDPVFSIGVISGRVSHQIVRLDRVASILAGRHAIVNCWSSADWTQMQVWQGDHQHAALIDASGITFLKERRIQLSPYVCQVLAQVMARSAQQPLFEAWAVAVLAHESAHAAGVSAENKAECRAITTESRAAELLGMPTARAERLPHIYRGTVYPYDAPAYRTPPCRAGNPGTVVPDTLGAPPNLRLLENVWTRVAPSLPPWRNIGGADSIGPLSPCAPIASRTLEIARLGYAFLGPKGEYVAYSSATLGTRRAFATALKRYQALPRCDLKLRRTEIREYHSTNTVSLTGAPAAITRLSPQVRAFRILFTSKGKKYNLDSIFVFAQRTRTLTTLFFSSPARTLPDSIEIRAARAMVQASSHG